MLLGTCRYAVASTVIHQCRPPWQFDCRVLIACRSHHTCASKSRVSVSCFLPRSTAVMSVRSPACPCRHSTYLLDLRWVKLESHRSQIVAHPLLLRRGGNRDDVLVDAPAERDFTGAHSVLLRELLQDFVGWSARAFGDSGERTVGACCNALMQNVSKDVVRGENFELAFFLW